MAAILDVRTEKIAILNFHDAPMSPSKFLFNTTYVLEDDVKNFNIDATKE